MGDEFRRLPGEHEIVRRAVAPAAHRGERRRAVEHAVELGARKLRRVKSEMMLHHHFTGKERPTPRLIAPARGADPDLRNLLLCTAFHHATGACRAITGAAAVGSGQQMNEGWLILAVLTFARTSMGFQFQSVAASSPLLIDQFGLSYAALGTLIGLYLLPGIAVAIPGGLLAQRFGDKRMLMLGIGAMAAGGALMGAADSAALLSVGRILSGTGGVIVNVLVSKMLTDWFAGREIATAFGILVISWPLGIAIALVVLPPLAGAWSWQAAMQMPAAICALALVLIALFYRTPDAVAAQPSGTLRFDLTRREFILIGIAGLIWTFYNVGFVMVPAFGPAFAAASGLSASAAGAIVSTMTWFVIPAVPLSAFFAERLGRADLAMYVSFALTAIALAVLA